MWIFALWVFLTAVSLAVLTAIYRLVAARDSPATGPEKVNEIPRDNSFDSLRKQGDEENE